MLLKKCGNAGKFRKHETQLNVLILKAFRLIKCPLPYFISFLFGTKRLMIQYYNLRHEGK